MTITWQDLQTRLRARRKLTIQELDKRTYNMPDDWVPFHNFIYRGEIKRKSEISESERITYVVKKDTLPPAPPPPEAKFTLEETVAEVFAILESSRHGVVHARLDALMRAHQMERNQGEISIQELVRSNREVQSIRDDHVQRVEAIVDWYLDRYFRLLEEPDPDHRPIRKREEILRWERPRTYLPAEEISDLL